MRRALLLALGLTLLWLPLSAQNLTSGLVFYAPFDGNTVNLVDWVKPVNTGAGPTTNKFGETNKAIYFDGQNDLLDYGDILNFGNGSFTISVWVKFDEASENNHSRYPTRILNKGMSGTSPDGYRGFAIKTVRTDNGAPDFRLVIADGSNVYYSSSIRDSKAVESMDNSWYHLVVVRSSVDNQLYLNGDLVATNEVSEPMKSSTDESFTLGGLLPGGNWKARELFAGSLDELRVYNRPLNERDIAALYQQFVGEEEGKQGFIELSVYPNPATRILKADFKEVADRRIEIVDAAGRNMFYGRFADQRAELNVSGLPPGIYFLCVREGERVVMHKFVKQGAVLP